MKRQSTVQMQRDLTVQVMPYFHHAYLVICVICNNPASLILVCPLLVIFYFVPPKKKSRLCQSSSIVYKKKNLCQSSSMVYRKNLFLIVFCLLKCIMMLIGNTAFFSFLFLGLSGTCFHFSVQWLSLFSSSLVWLVGLFNSCEKSCRSVYVVIGACEVVPGNNNKKIQKTPTTLRHWLFSQRLCKPFLWNSTWWYPPLSCTLLYWFQWIWPYFKVAGVSVKGRTCFVCAYVCVFVFSGNNGALNAFFVFFLNLSMHLRKTIDVSWFGGNMYH